MAQKSITSKAVQHRILTMLAQDSLSTQQIRFRLGPKFSVTGVRDTMAEMVSSGLARSVGFDQWAITVGGADACDRAGIPRRMDRVTKDKFGNPVESYVPVELRNSCVRPGAYDFMEHPSVIGDESVWCETGWRRVKAQAHTPPTAGHSAVGSQP